MATFFSNQTVGNWSGYTMKGTLTGNVGRSGNTVTLSGMTLSITASGAWGTDNNWWAGIYNGDTQLSRATGLTMNSGSGSKSIPNASITVSASDTSHTFNLRTSDGNRVNFSVSFPSGSTPPSGCYVTHNSNTWNSISITGGVSSWGSGNSNTKLNLMVIPYNATTYSGNARAGITSTTTNTSYTATLTNSNKWSADGGFNIVGASHYKVSCLAQSNNGNLEAVSSDTYWTPPSPPSTITKTAETQTSGSQNSVTISVVGVTANNASGAKVTRIYRVSTNGTWGQWRYLANMALVDAGTAQSGTFTVAQNANIIVEVKDRYFEGNTTSGTVHDSTSIQYSFVSAMDKPKITGTWNETRDTLSFSASCSSTTHNRMEILWGYDSTTSNVLAQSAAGATSLTATLSDPNHGSGQKIYYRARLLKADSTWLYGDTMQRNVLNPVLGVCIRNDGTKQYIVDIREKKKNQSTLTAAWQNGKRIVKN